MLQLLKTTRWKYIIFTKKKKKVLCQIFQLNVQFFFKNPLYY
jgi:hypothetical protein